MQTFRRPDAAPRRDAPGHRTHRRTDDDRTNTLAFCRGRCSRHLRRRHQPSEGTRYHQDRDSAFALGHDGDQRDHPQGLHADAGGRAQRKGGLLGKKSKRSSSIQPRTGRCSPRRRASCCAGEGRRGVRLLDVCLAQVGVARIRGAERPSVLSTRVRRRGSLQEHLLRWFGAGQQGHPGGRLPDEQGGRQIKRFVLEGTDYVYPRTSNKIIRAYLKYRGVADADIRENYTPFGFSDWQTEVAAIKAFGAQASRRPSFRRSTATPTCRSTRSSAARASRPRTFL